MSKTVGNAEVLTVQQKKTRGLQSFRSIESRRVFRQYRSGPPLLEKKVRAVKRGFGEALGGGKPSSKHKIRARIAETYLYLVEVGMQAYKRITRN